MFSVVIFIFILGVVIILHEFGHFVMAIKSKVRVEKFSFGFGPVIFSKKIKDTAYTICAVPFGGYVKLAGDNYKEYQGKPDEYLSKSCGVRSRIVVMGSLFNYLVAFLCFWLLFYLGYPVLTPKVGEVMHGYGAEEAGILSGDEIMEADGKSITYSHDLQKIIYSKKDNETVELKVQRQQTPYLFKVKVKEKEMPTFLGNKKKIGLIGIRPQGEVVFRKEPLFKAIVMGSAKVLELTQFTYQSIIMIIIGRLSLRESVTGPLGMFYITKEAANLGLFALLHLLAVLNISLAIFNLLPIPVLDGGHIFLLGIEKIRGKPLKDRTEEIITNIGLGFIVSLGIFIFYNDLIRFGIWEKVINFFKL